MTKTEKKEKNRSPKSAQRLDIFLSEKLKIARSQAQKMIENGEVLINQKTPKKTGQKISSKDNLEIIKPKKKKNDAKNKNLASKKETFSIKDVKIIKETPEYFIVEKPTGMLTHSTQANEKDSLAELMLKRFPELKKIGEDPMRPGIVHRLDKEASGLLIIARTEKMFEHLKEQFKKRTIEKEYNVLVHGKTSKDWDEIQFPIERSKTNDRMAAIPTTEKGLQTEKGKTALTEFWVEKRFVNFTMLRVKIHTGRMHQIRVHMLAYNHPVVGDPLYFQKKQKRIWDERLGRLFLHCCKLSFVDLEGKKITTESTLPETLQNFLKLLK